MLVKEKLHIGAPLQEWIRVGKCIFDSTVSDLVVMQVHV